MANNILNEWKNNQKAKGSVCITPIDYLLNRLAKPLIWIKLFSLSSACFLMGYRKLEAETSDNLCSCSVVVPLTPATSR